MQVAENVLEWLLGPDQPVVRYRTLMELLERPATDEDVRETYSEITKRGWAHEILKLQKQGGYWESRENLYRPKYLATNWRLIVLADFGLTRAVDRVRASCELMLEEWFRPEESVLDPGEVCVVGNFARTLVRCGYADDPRVKSLFDWLVDDQKEDGGWHCFRSATGTLDCWEGLAAFAALGRSRWTKAIRRSVERGVEFYLERHLYEEGRRRYAPWFRIHYPVHYFYDLLVGLETVTSLGFGDDRRLRPALEMLKDKRTPDGRWLLEAVHPDLGPGAKYKMNDHPPPVPFVLEEKGAPSKWNTLRALAVFKRVKDPPLSSTR